MDRSTVELRTVPRWRGRLQSSAVCVVALCAMAGAHAAGASNASSQASGGAAASLTEPLTLGMTYVPPPHQPGAKVRTPEGLAPLLADRLVRGLPVREVVTVADAAGATSVPDGADALLVPVVDAASADVPGRIVPTGYRAGVMAIMRTDTDITRWEDLRGRTVCLTEASGMVGQLQARYGAVEKVSRAPADALLDLRIGGCDAAVHDSTMLQALLQFPEWKKFSASLPVRDERDLAFVVSENDPALLRALETQVRQWREADLLAKLTRQSARDIAFEVYMDQEVPDCH